MAAHATVTPNVGGAAVVPLHHSVCLLVRRPAPPYRSFDGVRVHATIVCFIIESFWFPTDSILIFRREEPIRNLIWAFFHSNFHPKLIEKTMFFLFKFALHLITFVCSSGAAIS
jgi:hypothetical protein